MLRITKNRTKANIILARAACLVISFTVLIGITLYNNFAFADEVSSGNGNSQAGGNAQKCTPSSKLNLACGSAWRYYRLDSIQVGKGTTFAQKVTNADGTTTVITNTTGTLNQPAVITGCDNAGGFYLLGAEKTAGTGGSVVQYLGYQYGAVAMNSVSGYGGWRNYIGPENDAGPWLPTLPVEGHGTLVTKEEVKENYDIARKLADKGAAGTLLPWGGTMSWFCFNRDNPDAPPETNDPDTPPTTPDIPHIPNPGDNTSDATAEFYSTSTVHVDKTTDVMDAAGNALEVSSGKDGTAKVKFSTDASSVTVKFWHNLFYTSNFDSESDRVTGTPRTGWRSTTTTGVGGESKTGTWSVTAKRDDGSDVYNEIDDTLWRKQMCNEWRFYQKELKRKEKDEANGDEPDENNPYQLGFESYEYDIDWATVCNRSTTDKPDDYEEEPDDDSGDGGNSEALKKATDGQKVGEVSINVALYPGQTVTVCRTIDYKSKTVNFKLTNGNNDKRKYDKYKLSGYDGDTGQSSACAEITRPSEPEGYVDSTGTADSTIMFAGEDADISWDTYAESMPTRRLSGWQAVAYRTPVRYEYDNIDTFGNLWSTNRYRGAGACSYLRNKMHWDSCDIIGARSGTLNFGASDGNFSYNEEEDVVVPDTVGAKYCNTFAYKHEYWYAYDNGENEYWFKIPRLDYWNIFDSACRTIAKKPSTSIWNGSLLTNGGITTSLSYRFDHARMGRVNEGQARQLYGSWSEFLDVVNGNVSGLASGSTLANGSGRDRRNLCSDLLSTSNSPLTIANSNCGELGGSGIRSNSAFRVRLRTYLENQATPIGDALGEMNNVTGTTILKRTGNLNITGDIILANGPYSDIYHIPQVIIFVEGDVNISSNVTRLDAWIIATGTINTCPEFQMYKTESDAENRLRDTCTKQLIFNGPIMAKNLVLRRSFGSDNIVARWSTYGWRSDKQSSAEVFNLRMDNYLWAYAQAGRYDSSYTESYSRELAPRY